MFYFNMNILKNDLTFINIAQRSLEVIFCDCKHLAAALG